jgi:hypothetical protein
LSLEEIRQRAPAVFATAPSDRLSQRYIFIQTQRVLEGLAGAGFVPTEARQWLGRRSDAQHARHMIRLRRRCETVALHECVPEVVFLNSHNGSSGYQLRMGIFRALCTNGLIVSVAMFPAFCVSHRKDVVDEAIAGALSLAERFDELGVLIERMQRRQLSTPEQARFAEQAMQLRYPVLADAGVTPTQLLHVRRPEDDGADLWRTFNRVQENLLRGGFRKHSANGRVTAARRISSISEDVRINGALWDLSSNLVAA